MKLIKVKGSQKRRILGLKHLVEGPVGKAAAAGGPFVNKICNLVGCESLTSVLWSGCVQLVVGYDDS
jgi:hypothetical protein